MNNKIITSLAVIAVATLILAGGTIAYFGDTEKSAGNTFTAGTIDLKIDSQCRYNGGNCPNPNSSWALTDLDNGVHKFFDFSDIKPGYWGENTISLHLTNNPAWVWARLKVVENLENGCNEPELKAEPGCAANNIGELAGKLNYLIWQDDNCSNTIDPGEYIFKNGGQASGLIDSCRVLGLKVDASGTPGALQPTDAGAPYCVGVAWCAGNWVPGVNPQLGSWNCDGSIVGNEAQGDSLKMDVEFDVAQWRHNQNAEGGPVCP